MKGKMRKLMKRKLAKVLIGVVIAVLLLGTGVALAYTTLWSGTASITIEEVVVNGGGGGGGGDPPPPDPPLPLEVTEVFVTSGNITDGVWTVTLHPGDSTSLWVAVSNPRDTIAVIQARIDGNSTWPQGDHIELAPGVFMRTDSYGFTTSINPGSTGRVSFTISTATLGAEIGTIPDIRLEVWEGDGL